MILRIQQTLITYCSFSGPAPGSLPVTGEGGGDGTWGRIGKELWHALLA